MNQPFQKKVKEITGAYTLTLADLSYAIRCNSATPFTVTLPTASGFPNFHVDLINVGSGAVTCNGVTLLQGNGLQLYCNASTWTNLKIINSVAIADIPVMTSSEFAGKISDETGTGKVVFSDNATMVLPTVDGVQLNTSAPTSTMTTGTIRWNATEICAEVGEPNGGSLQIGQESRLYAKNRQGATINEGYAVYVYSAAGQNVEVKLADADDYTQSKRTLAVATENVADNANGRFTCSGFVRTLNTGSWAEGDVLYLSSTPGVLVNVRPTYPINPVRVAIVTRSHASQGEIFVCCHHENNKFGDPQNGNFTGFEDDGTMVFNGTATVYDDILNQLIGQRLESPSSRITQNTAEGSVVFATNTELTDYVVMNIQISHSWKMGTDLYPHLHWWQAQNNVPNWLLQYRWQRNGQAKTTAWTSVKMNTNAFTYSSGTLCQISGFPAITPPSNYSISDILQCRVLRDNANTSGLFAGADPYTGSVSAVNFDSHYIRDMGGSRQEYSK